MSDCEHCVMVVEDDDDIRASVSEVLKDGGYSVVAARNGAEALSLLQTSARPCVVVVDLMMPVMNGWELVTELRAHREFADLPVVITSAAADRSPPGVDRVLTKPIDLDALVGTVESYCGPHAGAVEISREQLHELARRNVELAELQRFRDDLSAMIVHDLKNPATVILTNVAYVRASGVSEEDRNAALDDVETAARRMLRLLSDLLDLARFETGRFLPRRRPTDLTGLVREAIRGHQGAARANGLAIESSVAMSVSANVDPDLLQRAIDNLLDNACRFARERVVVILSLAADRLELVIANDGPLIPAEERRRVFDKFYRLRDNTSTPGNFGLGLYFCRLAVEAHGGTIRVDALGDLSTAFVIELSTQ